MSIKNPYFWLIALVSIILDQLTKYIISSRFFLHESVPLWKNVLHLTYVHNYGAAFSLFSQSGGWLKWLSLIVSIALIMWGCFSPKISWLEQLGYGLILGGAIGNGIDRFLLGYVVDYFEFRLIRFPVFNIADVSINLGIASLILTQFPPFKSPTIKSPK